MTTTKPPIDAAEQALGRELLALFRTLQAIHGTSGDEGRVADWVADRLRSTNAATPVTVARRGETLVVVKGRPRVAVFAHLDTVGFMTGHDRRLFEIGAPDAAVG